MGGRAGYHFDIMALLRKNGPMTCREICSGLTALLGTGWRTEDSVSRILEDGHNHGYFFRMDQVGAGRASTLWGFTPEPFAVKDFVRDTEIVPAWLGQTRQAQSLIAQEEIVTQIEQLPDLPFREIGDRMRVEHSMVERAAKIFRVAKEGKPPTACFFKGESAYLRARTRQKILGEIAEGVNWERTLQDNALSNSEYGLLFNLRKAHQLLAQPAPVEKKLFEITITL